MSLIFMDSFDGYTQNEIPNYWLSVATSPSFFGVMNTFLSLPARTGPQAIAPPVFGIARGMGIPPISPFDILHGGQQFVLIGAAYYFGTASAGQPIFRFFHGGPQGTIMLTLARLGDGRLAITKQFAATVLAVTSAAIALKPNQYNYIEWKTGFSNTAPNEIRINGQVVYSGVLNGQVGAFTTADVFALNAGLYDDLYICALDGAGVHNFLGDSSVPVFIPASDGTYQQFDTIPPVASHYLNVKEIPLDNNGSYNASVGSGSADTYGVTPTLPTTDTIQAVQLSQAVEDIDGDLDLARAFIEVNGAVYDTPFDNYLAPSSYIPVQLREYEVNPITSAAWLPADFNLTNWGIQQV